MKNIISKITVFTILISFTFGLISCTNSTSSENDHDHEHEEAAGVLLKINGSVVVKQLPGEDPIGEFELTPGDETDLISVFFIGEDGDEFQPEEDEFSLSAEFDDESIVEFEQHEEDGKWRFHLHAESEGITNMRIVLLHVDHSDFTSRDIHVHVEAAE